MKRQHEHKEERYKRYKKERLKQNFKNQTNKISKIKNLLDILSSKLETRKEKIRDLEVKAITATQIEAQREKKLRKNRHQ